MSSMNLANIVPALCGLNRDGVSDGVGSTPVVMPLISTDVSFLGSSSLFLTATAFIDGSLTEA